MISLTDVRHKCVEGRFLPYDDWRDRLFVPPSIFLVWIFVNLGWSANAVSWLSGAVTIVGGMLIATNDRTLIFLGSCSYVIYYLLDYVDGGVARYRKADGVTGQYIDWLMHSISAISISIGIFIGALNNTHALWIVPFGILFVLASSLQLDKFSLGWWAICMYRQQGRGENKAASETNNKGEPLIWRFMKITSDRLFHENNAIFLLPIAALLNIFISGADFPDFRLIVTVIGGAVYFPFVVHEITTISKNKKLEAAYDKLFYPSEKPDLPGGHFFC